MSWIGRWWPAFAVLVVAALASAALLVGRLSREGERAMHQSDAAFNAGDVRQAVVHARRAAGLYVPGASHVQQAYDRMLAAAKGAEAAGDAGLARFAWSSVRAAALESRHLGAPRRSELERAELNLARLLDGPEAEPGIEPAAPLRPEASAPVTRLLLLAALVSLACGVATYRSGARSRSGARWPSWALTALGVSGWLVAIWSL